MECDKAMNTLNNHSTESDSQTAYDMTAGDPTGEVDGPETISPEQWNNDCPDFCLGGDLESTTELMRVCKQALDKVEMMGKDMDVRFAHSLVFYSQRIGEYVINQLIENKITADMLEVEK